MILKIVTIDGASSDEGSSFGFAQDATAAARLNSAATHFLLDFLCLLFPPSSFTSARSASPEVRSGAWSLFSAPPEL
eukprot:1972544-Pleurochrysis_carterae.AAC.1